MPNDPPSDQTILELTRRFFPPASGVGEADLSISPLPGGGSDRQYWRLSLKAADASPASAIYMFYTDARPDNLCFISAAEVFSQAGVSIPEIYAHDPDSMSIWLEDLGNIHLWDYRHEPWERREPLYQDTLREIAKIHAIGEASLPESTLARLQPGFDETLYAWEQNYFFDQFLARFSLLPAKNVTALRDDGSLVAVRQRLAAQPRQLVHRDFQSQNVLVRDGNAVIIDFQGLRAGRPEYDIASLLYDPYVELTADERESLIEFYLGIADVPAASFRQNLADCAVQRLMQALGAYGFLSTHLGKTQFLRYIPQAAGTVTGLVADGLAPGLLDTCLKPEAFELPE